jgi:hypothetical protein
MVEKYYILLKKDERCTPVEYIYILFEGILSNLHAPGPNGHAV